jgi:regulator of protease activity HflC (stomatin/prohibitin superfamily)
MGIVGLIVAVILIIAAIIGVMVALFSPNSDDKGIGVGVTVVCTILAVIVFGLSSMREVTNKSVGVPTAFGHVESPLRPGLHFKAPWTKVNILNETIQTETFGSDSNSTGGQDENCVNVRIGGQQLACWNGTIQWKINDKGASQVFNNYGNNNESIMSEAQNAIVDQSLQSVLNQTFGDYNPIEDVQNTSTSSLGNSQFSTLSRGIKAAMIKDVGVQVTITRLISKNLSYDKATEANIARIQQQYGKTAVAQEEIKTNEDLSKANKALSTSVTCGTLTQEAITNNYILPAAWNCSGTASNLALAIGGK